MLRQQTGRRQGPDEPPDSREDVVPTLRTAASSQRDVDDERRQQDADRHGRPDSGPRRVRLAELVPAVFDLVVENLTLVDERATDVDGGCGWRRVSRFQISHILNVVGRQRRPNRRRHSPVVSVNTVLTAGECTVVSQLLFLQNGFQDTVSQLPVDAETDVSFAAIVSAACV